MRKAPRCCCCCCHARLQHYDHRVAQGQAGGGLQACGSQPPSHRAAWWLLAFVARKQMPLPYSTTYAPSSPTPPLTITYTRAHAHNQYTGRPCLAASSPRSRTRRGRRPWRRPWGAAGTMTTTAAARAARRAVARALACLTPQGWNGTLFWWEIVVWGVALVQTF
jgi:hypothetical protein